MKHKVLLSLILWLIFALPAWAEMVGAPGSPIVPGFDLDGGYSVTWTPSATSGAQYVLEEAIDPGFAESAVVYQGKATKAKLKGRFAGRTYHYRVKATLPGYEDSAWTLAANGCAVPYQVSVKGNAGGSMTVNGEVVATVPIPVGEARTVAVTPDEGFHLVSVLVDGAPLVDDSNKAAPYAYAWPAVYAFNLPDELIDNSKNKHTVKVKFAVNSYQVTTTAGSGGKITPVGPKTFKHGKQATYTITPDQGQRIASVLVNGEPQSGLPSNGAYKLALEITGETAIEASFIYGGGGDGDYAYVGKTDPALLTADSAVRFIRFLFAGVLIEPPTGGVTGRSAAVSLGTSAFPDTALAVNAVSSYPIKGTIYGSVSGTATYSGSINTDGSGNVAFKYDTFNDGDGYTYDGRMKVIINAFDFATEILTDARVQLSPLLITSPEEQIGMQGEIDMTFDIPSLTERMVFTVDGRNDPGAESFRSDHVEMTSIYDRLENPESSIVTVTGRLYLGDEGYVEISQVNPLRFDYLGRFNVDVPNAGGPLFFTGAANSQARFTPLSVGQLLIEVDSDGDAMFESAETWLWSELVGIVFTWEMTYGTGNFEVANSAQETSDGGTISAGWINTWSEKQLDVYLVKTDAAGGLQWARTFGGYGDDTGWAVLQTRDEGFIVVGTTTDGSGLDKVGYVVKTDSQGELIWEYRLPEHPESQLHAVLQNADGDYVITGAMYSWSWQTGQVGLGFDDLILLKLDGQGALLFEKRFGGSGSDVGWSVKESGDGGFILAGVTDSFDSSQNREQIYLVKTDAAGNLIWERNFGNELPQYGYDAEVAANGDLVALGYAATYTGNTYYLIRVNSNGNLLWERNIGSTANLYQHNDLVITPDDSLVVAGNDSFDVHLMKMSDSGDLVWDRIFNWSQYYTMCTAASVVQTSDSGFLIGGSAWPNSGKDFYLIKTNQDGIIW